MTDREAIWRALHALINDETKRIVLGVPDDGWSAWRRLCQYFNPTLAAMEERVWDDLGVVSHNVAKSPEETKTIINELSIRIERVESITGEKVGSAHAKSILLAFIDPVTRQHTFGMHGKITDYEAFRQGCLQFINATGGSSSECRKEPSIVPVDIPPDGAHAEIAQCGHAGTARMVG